jgi:protein-S-isoprenylcysteine O-methyltransferase Ste14
MQRFFARPAGSTRGMKIISGFGAAFAAMQLAAIIWIPVTSTAQAIAATALYCCALGLFWWSIKVNSPKPLSAAFSPDSPEHLVKQGPYRLIRHPFYCSYLLMWTAGIVATASLWLVPTVAVMLVVYARAARLEEEKFTRSGLASSYEQYRSQTGLFLPNPLKLLMARRP